MLTDETAELKLPYQGINLNGGFVDSHKVDRDLIILVTGRITIAGQVKAFVQNFILTKGSNDGLEDVFYLRSDMMRVLNAKPIGSLAPADLQEEVPSQAVVTHAAVPAPVPIASAPPTASDNHHSHSQPVNSSSSTNTTTSHKSVVSANKPDSLSGNTTVSQQQKEHTTTTHGTHGTHISSATSSTSATVTGSTNSSSSTLEVTSSHHQQRQPHSQNEAAHSSSPAVSAVPVAPVQPAQPPPPPEKMTWASKAKAAPGPVQPQPVSKALVVTGQKSKSVVTGPKSEGGSGPSTALTNKPDRRNDRSALAGGDANKGESSASRAPAAIADGANNNGKNSSSTTGAKGGEFNKDIDMTGARTVFVKGTTPFTQRIVIIDAFKKFGEVVHFNDKHSVDKAFVHVHFATPEECQRAVAAKRVLVPQRDGPNGPLPSVSLLVSAAKPSTGIDGFSSVDADEQRRPSAPQVGGAGASSRAAGGETSSGGNRRRGEEKEGGGVGQREGGGGGQKGGSNSRRGGGGGGGGASANGSGVTSK